MDQTWDFSHQTACIYKSWLYPYHGQPWHGRSHKMIRDSNFYLGWNWVLVLSNHFYTSKPLIDSYGNSLEGLQMQWMLLPADHKPWKTLQDTNLSSAPSSISLQLLFSILIFCWSTNHCIALLVTYRLHIQCMRVNI